MPAHSAAQPLTEPAKPRLMDFNLARLALDRGQTVLLDRNEPAPAARRVPAAPRRAVVAEAPRLTLGRGIAGIDEAQNNLAAFLRTVGCDARTLFRAELVLRETLLNIRQHADLPHRPAHVWIETWLEDRQVVVAVEDDGPAFDPRQFVPGRHGDRPAHKAPGGLRLIRRNADSLRYVRTQIGHNRLELGLTLAS